MPKIIANMIRDFKNIYMEEDAIREAYGEEYAKRHSNINPKTGKKLISGTKLLTRVFIVFLFLLCLTIVLRIVLA